MSNPVSFPLIIFANNGIIHTKVLLWEACRLNYEKKITDGNYMIKFEKVFKKIMFRKCRWKK